MLAPQGAGSYITKYIFPVKKRIDFKILTLTYKCLHSKGPQYLEELIKLYNVRTDIQSVDDGLLKEPLGMKKTLGDRAFSVAAPSLCNVLPLEIRNSDSLDSFKYKLKTYLLNLLS